MSAIPALKTSGLLLKWALVKTKGDTDKGKYDLVVKVDALKAIVRVCVVSMKLLPFPSAMLLYSAWEASQKVSVPPFPIVAVRIVNGETFKANEENGDSLKWPLSVDPKRSSFQRKDAKAPVLHLLYLPLHEEFYMNSLPRNTAFDIMVKELMCATDVKARSIEMSWRLDIDWQTLQDLVEKKQVGKPTTESTGYTESGMPDYLHRLLMAWPANAGLQTALNNIVDDINYKVNFDETDANGTVTEMNPNFKSEDPLEDDLDDRFTLVHTPNYVHWQAQFGVKKGRVMNSKLDGVNELGDKVLEFLYRELWVDDAFTGRDKLSIPRIWNDVSTAGGGLTRLDTPTKEYEDEDVDEHENIDEQDNEGEEAAQNEEEEDATMTVG